MHPRALATVRRRSIAALWIFYHGHTTSFRNRKHARANARRRASGFIRADPAKERCRGILAAQSLKPQAVTLAESRGIACVAVDLAVLRGEREPELTLFV